MKKNKYLYFSLVIITMLLLPRSSNGQHNNSTYDEVIIGTQIWMKKNLDVTTYRDGTPIPEVKDANEWAKLTTGAWCYYNNDPAHEQTYGKLYNWYAVNDTKHGGLAPKGWSVPSDNKWKMLITFLGGGKIAGDKMRENGTSHWETPNRDATNSSGFTGLPGGNRSSNGTFSSIGYIGFWWSSTKINNRNAGYCSLAINDDNYTDNSGSFMKKGFSVRCIRE